MAHVEVRLAAALALALGACAPAVVLPASSATPAPRHDRRAMMRQLRGHLAHVEGCHAAAVQRDATASALIDVRFTIEPTGEVEGVELLRDTAADRELSACVARRLSSLYFDPAPDVAITFSRRFEFCRATRDGFCELGPAAPITAEDPHPRRDGAIAAALYSFAPRLSECQRDVSPADAAVMTILVTVGRDGHVMSGVVRDVDPVASPLRSCAIEPLLGSALGDALHELALDEPVSYRYTFALGPRVDRQ